MIIVTAVFFAALTPSYPAWKTSVKAGFTHTAAVFFLCAAAILNFYGLFMYFIPMFTMTGSATWLHEKYCVTPLLITWLIPLFTIGAYLLWMSLFARLARVGIRKMFSVPVIAIIAFAAMLHLILIGMSFYAEYDRNTAKTDVEKAFGYPLDDPDAFFRKEILPGAELFTGQGIKPFKNTYTLPEIQSQNTPQKLEKIKSFLCTCTDTLSAFDAAFAEGKKPVTKIKTFDNFEHVTTRAMINDYEKLCVGRLMLAVAARSEKEAMEAYRAIKRLQAYHLRIADRVYVAQYALECLLDSEILSDESLVEIMNDLESLNGGKADFMRKLFRINLMDDNSRMTFLVDGYQPEVPPNGSVRWVFPVLLFSHFQNHAGTLRMTMADFECMPGKKANGLDRMKLAYLNYMRYYFREINITMARISAMRILCACMRYKLAEGRLPDTLQELVPRFIDRLPTDTIGKMFVAVRCATHDVYVINKSLIAPSATPPYKMFYIVGSTPYHDGKSDNEVQLYLNPLKACVMEK